MGWFFVTYQGPQQPWRDPSRPAQPQGYPGYPPGYPQQPKKKTGLIVGIILGIVVVLGLGIGAVFVFTGKDEVPASTIPGAKPAAKTDLTKLETACQFLSPEELSAKNGAKGLQSRETEKKEPDLVSFAVGCQYFLPDGSLAEAVYLRVYQPGTCDPQYCLDVFKGQNRVALKDIGQNAVFFKRSDARSELIAVQLFGEIPVVVDLVGTEQSTAQELGPLAQEILAKVGS